MSDKALQHIADQRIRNGMDEYLGSGHGFLPQPVQFDVAMHSIQVRWRWFLEVGIRERTVAGSFKDTGADKYFKSAEGAREAAEDTARQVQDGHHGFAGKLSLAIAEQPVAGFGTSTLALGSVTGTYNYQFNCNPCSGRGKVTCIMCNGKLTTKCTRCWGLSKLSCTICSGSGFFTYEENTRHGWVPRVRQCSPCLGRGVLDCNICNLGRVSCSRCQRTGTETCSSCSGHGHFTQRLWLTVKGVRHWSINYPENIAEWGKVFIADCLNSGDGPAKMLQTAAFEEAQPEQEHTNHAQFAFSMKGKLPMIEYLLRNGGAEYTTRMVGYRADVEHWGHLADFPAQNLSQPFLRDPRSLEAAKRALALPVNDLIVTNLFGSDKSSVAEEHKGIISTHYQATLLRAIHQLVAALTHLRKTTFRRSVPPLALVAFLALMGGGVLINVVFPGVDWSGAGISMLIDDWRGVLKQTAQQTIEIPMFLFSPQGSFVWRLGQVGAAYGIALLLTMTLSPLGAFRRGNLLLAVAMLPAMVLLLIVLSPALRQMSDIPPNLQLTSLDSEAWIEGIVQATRQLFGSLAIALLVGLALARRRARRIVRRAKASVGNRHLEVFVKD